jgi:hypothetical protein
MSRRTTAVALLFVASLLAGCSINGASPGASGPACAADTKAPGTNPDLEVLLPHTLDGKAPTLVDSGSNCTAGALGTYASHGVSQLRFAGATWDEGNGDGTVIALMSTQAPQPAIQAAWVEDFYTTGAKNGTHTENITTARPRLPGAGAVFRLEALNDLSLQTVVVWPSGHAVWVVIVATTVDPNASRAAHDQQVLDAVATAAAMTVP